MTKRVLEIAINCGDETCYSKPGKPCPYVRTQRFGQEYVCQLFHETGDKPEPETADGWMARHPECIRKERR